MTNKRKLNAAMALKGYTQEKLAKELGLSKFSINKKINGVSDFKAKEIQAICQILQIKNKDEIFFAKEVDLKSPKRK